jgi:hypothetical protein
MAGEEVEVERTGYSAEMVGKNVKTCNSTCRFGMRTDVVGTSEDDPSAVSLLLTFGVEKHTL